MHQPTYTGGCYCGNLQLAIGLSQSPADYQPRACDCEFCCKHGAAWVSDPNGTLTISVRDDAHLRRLRQGDELAEFLLCADCGVVVAVCYEADGKRFAAINARAVNFPHGHPGAFAESVPASPKRLSATEKTTRWQQLWFRNVNFR